MGGCDLGGGQLGLPAACSSTLDPALHVVPENGLVLGPKYTGNPWLVGGIPTPLKNMKVSWNYYSQSMEKWKPCSKPPTRWGFSPKLLGDRPGDPSFELPFPLTLHLALGLILILLDLGCRGVLRSQTFGGVEMGFSCLLWWWKMDQSRRLSDVWSVSDKRKNPHIDRLSVLAFESWPPVDLYPMFANTGFDQCPILK